MVRRRERWIRVAEREREGGNQNERMREREGGNQNESDRETESERETEREREEIRGRQVVVQKQRNNAWRKR